MIRNRLLLISICTKVLSSNEFEFHFNGVYLGEKIKSVRVKGDGIKLYEEYILKLEPLNVKSMVLYTRLVGLKLINEVSLFD